MRQFKALIMGLTLFVVMTGCGSGSSGQDTPNDTLRIACVGDSITEGYGLENPDEESYPAQLSKLVADGGTVQNFGTLGGPTLIKAGARSYWDTDMYKSSLSFNPDIVVIMLGTNDMQDVNFANRDDIVEDYKSLIESYRGLSSQPMIYICFPPPSYGSVQGITNERIEEVLLPKLREVSSQNSVSVIDMYTLLSDKRNLFPDTLHPNVEGAGEMANAVYATVY